MMEPHVDGTYALDQAGEVLRALHASQSENEALFHAIPDMILRVRRDGTYLRYKPPREFQPWKHESPAEVVGKSIRDSVPHDVAVRALAAMEAAFTTKRTQHFQFTLPVAGVLCHREARIAAADENEALIIIRDITERRQAECERRAAEQRLEQQQQLLAHASRLNIIGEMAAGLAHELTQPLGAISNFAAAAATTLENAAVVDHSRLLQWNQKIIEQASRAGQIIDRLRRYAQRSEPMRAPQSLREIVPEAIELVQTHARRQGVAMSLVDDASGSLTVVVDRVQMQQVVVNLLNNAIDALEAVPAGQRNIVVRIEAAEASAAIHVEDTGCGLPPVELEQLFEPFFTTKPAGVGMGLTICRSILQAHDGTISAANIHPQGARFTFTLARAS